MNSRSQILSSDLKTLQALYLELHAESQKKTDALTEKNKALIEQLDQKSNELEEKNQLIETLNDTIATLQERLNLLLSKRYSAQSESLQSLQGQLFDEAELEQAIRDTEAAIAEAQAQVDETQPDTAGTSTPKPEKQIPKRKSLPDHLRRVDIEIDVSPEDKQMMGDDWVLVGYEVSEQLAVQQREYYVKCLKRAKYARKHQPEDKANDMTTEAGIKVAPRPAVMLPKAIADATLLGDVLASKFIDGLSFYRTHKRLAREGIDIGYSTLCDWPIQLLERLKPFERVFYSTLSKSACWHLDETTLQVLQETDRKAQQKSYLWAIRGGPPDQPIVAFHYSPSRSYEALKTWLAPCLDDFKGVVISDDYGAYNRMKNKHEGIKAHGGCWAHARRKFADAAKGRSASSDAHKVLQKIAVLYRLEHQTESLMGEAKKAKRQQLVQPQLDNIKAYLDTLSKQYLKQGLMHTAIRYLLNQWPKFTAFVDHPELPIDNNPIEQAIRPFTIGRKNWLFAGSPRGAHASAFIYSLVETAKANGWEPKAYLIELFTRFPAAKTEDEIRALLPMFLKMST